MYRISAAVFWRKMFLFVFSCLFALTAGSSCPVEIQPSSVVVKFGDPIAANCTSTSSDSTNMGWESPQGSTQPEMVQHVALQIDQLKHWLLVPQCYINLKVSPFQCSKTLQVTVYKPPDLVSIQSASEIQPQKQDSERNVKCVVTNVAPPQNLRVLWHIGTRVVSSRDFQDAASSSSPINVTTHYTWRPRGEDDGKDIWCEARMEFGPTGPTVPATKSKMEKLTVFYPPKFAVEEERITLKGREGITLSCAVPANPDPEYTWQFPPSVPQTPPTGNHPVLNVSFPMPGTYNCTAANEFGQVAKTFIVSLEPRDRTVMAAVIGSVVAAGVLLAVVGYLGLQPDGTFSFCKSSGSVV